MFISTAGWSGTAPTIGNRPGWSSPARLRPLISHRRQHARLAQTIPEARIICIFRDPVERILSHYRVKRAYGMIAWDLEQAILRDPELMESNKYATHFKAWQRTLGADRVLATLYDDLRDKPQTYVDILADAVGVTRFALAPTETAYVYASKNMTLPRSYPLNSQRHIDGGLVQSATTAFDRLVSQELAPKEGVPRRRSAVCRIASKSREPAL